MNEHKQSKFIIDVSSQAKRPNRSTTRFFSYDSHTAEIVIQAEKDGKLIDQALVDTVEIYFESVNMKYRPIDGLKWNDTMEIGTDGLYSYILPDDFLNYEGLVAFDIYINYKNGDRADSSNRIIFEQRISAIDRAAGAVELVYIKDMEIAKREITEQATEITENFSREWNAFEAGSTAKMQELEQRIDEQTEIFNNADVYNKAEIEDKLEPFALQTDIAEVSTQLAQIKTEKISKGNVSVSDIDKNLGKLDQTYMSDEFLQQMGGNTPINSTPADNTLTTQKYVDKSVTRAKIADVFQFVGNVDDGTDLNTITKEGTYSLTNSHTYVNCPPELQGKTANLMVRAVNYNNRFLLQTGFVQYEPNTFIIRRVDTVSTGTTDWVNLKSFSMSDIPQKSLGGELIKDKTLVRNHLDKRTLNNGVVSAGDFNTLTDDGNYFIAGTLSNLPLNAPSYGILTVRNVGNFTHQIYTDLYSPENRWVRYVQTNVSNYGAWVDLNKTSNTGLPLEGKQVVNFGDSIFGNKRGTDSVSHFIGQRTGATVYNMGFGGSRIAKHDNYWDAFSLYRLADEIVKDDTDTSKWQLQDEAIAAGLSGMPAYYSEALELLKTLDFNTINYITIAGGTNDFTASVELDNDLDKYDTTTLGGAFRYALEKLWNKYPHLKILICSPIYRAWVDANDQFIEDSEVRTYNGKYLYDFVEKEREIAKEYKTPFLDNYYELGINRYNRTLYYPSWDGTHPNVTGNTKIGYKIGSKLISEF